MTHSRLHLLTLAWSSFLSTFHPELIERSTYCSDQEFAYLFTYLFARLSLWCKYKSKLRISKRAERRGAAHLLKASPVGMCKESMTPFACFVCGAISSASFRRFDAAHPSLRRNRELILHPPARCLHIQSIRQAHRGALPDAAKYRYLSVNLLL